MSNPGIYSRWYQVMHLLASSCKHLRWPLQTQKRDVLHKTSGLKLRCSPPILPEDLPAVDLADYHRKRKNWAGGFFFSWYCCSPRCASAVIVCWSVFSADPFLEFSCLIGCGTVSTMRGFTSCSFHDSTGASEAVKAVPIGFILDRACGKVRLCSTWPTVQQLGQPLYRKCWGRWRATKACKTLQDKAVGWYRLAYVGFRIFSWFCMYLRSSAISTICEHSPFQVLIP